MWDDIPESLDYMILFKQLEPKDEIREGKQMLQVNV